MFHKKASEIYSDATSDKQGILAGYISKCLSVAWSFLKAFHAILALRAPRLRFCI